MWEVDGIIGSLAYSSKKHIVYMLTEDGDILSVDENTGEKSAVVHFSSTPFIINGENIYAYQLAYDESEDILFVSLGDSKQLFAFKENYP